MGLIRVSMHGGWSSRWTFIAAATATVVGLGNIWKFAYLAGMHGGAGFVLLYLACIVLVALPLLIAELVLGSRGRADPIHTMEDLYVEATASRGWVSIGWLGVVAALLVLSYCSVVAGWLLEYIGIAGRNELEAASGRLAGERFGQLLTDPWRQVGLHSVFMLVAAIIVALGVRRGLGSVAKRLLPLLMLTLLGLVYYAWRYGDMSAAMQFMFSLRPEQLTRDTLLAALGQAFFSLGIGMGAMMAYGAYLPDRRSIVGMVSVVVVLNVAVALLAGLAIFPLVFSLHIEPNFGPGLMFVTLPYVFGNMQYGDVAGTAFFFLVWLITLGSAVALLEPGTAWLVQRFRWKRPLAALALATLSWMIGVLVIGGLSWWHEVRWLERGLFAWFDLVTANLLLPLVGLLIAIFVGWKMRSEALRDELYAESALLVWLWRWLLRYIALPAIAVILAAGMYRIGWG